jgi:preprotein translocase subunit YajC
MVAHAISVAHVTTGVGVPIAALIIIGLVVLIVVLVVMIRRKGQVQDDWEIRYDELEVGEHLGTGGFGDVSRATWKGTEVAVKVMASDRVTKDLERSFKEEVCPKTIVIIVVVLQVMTI